MSLIKLTITQMTSKLEIQSDYTLLQISSFQGAMKQ